VQCGVYDEADPIGIYATDEEAYKVFDDLFIPIIQDLHPDYDMKVNYRNEFDLVSVPNFQKLARLKVSVRRNFKDHPFTPMMSTESKFQVEKKIIETLGEVYGQYHKYSRLDDETKAWLDSEGIDITKQAAHDSAGINEDWPNGRGVFIDDNKEFVVLVNFEDHIQLITICNGGDYNKSLSTLLKLLSKFEKMGYARHTTLGFLTASPKNLGTGLQIDSVVKLANERDSDDIESYEGTYS
jgi:arginine kinase